MSAYLTNSIKARYKKTVKQLRKEIGVLVEINSPDTNTQCPNCYWDEVGQRSSGVYNGTGPTPFTSGKCPVCNGAGVIGSANNLVIKATRYWRRVGEKGYGEPGTSEDNTVRLRAPRGYLSTFKNSKYVTVDGVDMEVVRTGPCGFDNISCEVILKRSD